MIQNIYVFFRCYESSIEKRTENKKENKILNSNIPTQCYRKQKKKVSIKLLFMLFVLEVNLYALARISLNLSLPLVCSCLCVYVFVNLYICPQFDIIFHLIFQSDIYLFLDETCDCILSILL